MDQPATAPAGGRLEPGPIPLYYQLEQELRRRIESAEFAPGAAFLTEDQICEQYGVSRITVRRALESLCQQQMIEWIAHWIQKGGATLDKPTHFQTRDGKF